MNETPYADTLALRDAAAAIEFQCDKLPVRTDLARSPETLAVEVALRISKLGQLIDELGDEVLFRAAAHDPEAHTGRVVAGFAAAVGPTAEAASALGTMAHQLALHAVPDAEHARQGGARTTAEALDRARTALRQAADGLPYRRSDYLATLHTAPGSTQPVHDRRSRPRITPRRPSRDTSVGTGPSRPVTYRPPLAGLLDHGF